MATFSQRPASLAHVRRARRGRGGAALRISRLSTGTAADLEQSGDLDAAHERMTFFAFVWRDEVMAGLRSSVASVQSARGDRMFANPWLFGDLRASAGSSASSPVGSV